MAGSHSGTPGMASLARIYDVNLSTLASTARAWRGTAAFRPARKQPEQVLELYEYEGCPYCRLVREALTELDLDAKIYPCPKGGQRFRPGVKERGGKLQFPFLVDPNTGSQMYESAAIINYLRETYAGRRPRSNPLARSWAVGSSSLTTVMRAPRGYRVVASRSPAQPLELYSFESSPFSRLVRERLSEMEIPYLLRNTGKALWQDMGPSELRARLFPDEPVQGRNRQALLNRAGKVQVPYLIDPNTGTEMFESAKILRYLEQEYGRS